MFERRGYCANAKFKLIPAACLDRSVRCPHRAVLAPIRTLCLKFENFLIFGPCELNAHDQRFFYSQEMIDVLKRKANKVFRDHENRNLFNQKFKMLDHAAENASRYEDISIVDEMAFEHFD